MDTAKRCHKCHEGVMRNWDELSDEERELVKRLPGSADYKAAERESMHQWCNRCWHESRIGETAA